MVAGRLDGDSVGRAVDVVHLVLRRERHLEGEFLQRGRGLGVGLQRIGILDQSGIARGDGREADHQLLVAAGRHGEDTQAQQVGAHVLEQPRVLGAADDVGVDLAGLVGLDHLAADFLTVHPQGELVDRGALGHREDVGGFERPVGVVAEDLRHLRDGRLFDDGDHDVVADHRQRRHFLVGGDKQAGGAGRAGGQQAGQESG